MLTLNFGVPALIFSTLTKLDVSPAEFGEIFGIFGIFLAANLIIGAILLKMFKLEIGAFLPALSFPNNGNMGLPLCLFAFGDVGLALGISVFVLMSTANVTIGFACASGKWSLISMLKTPFIWIIAAALIFMCTETAPPRWVANTAEIIGGMSIPLMLVALGVSLSRLEVSDFKKSFWLSFVRLFIGFGLGVSLAELFELQGVTRGVLILQCAMPTAVMNYLLAARFDREANGVAGIVVVSTFMSLATLPFLMLFVLQG
ncbi:MAG: transporter [Rhodospirillaceae bacterium]|nr:transporter [Rhodospirillaceae bacterium]